MIYDTIIVSEKPIAGQSIAYILANGKLKENKEKGQVTFEFENEKFGKTIMVPLKGHITDIDFTREFASWYMDLKKLVTPKAIFYKNTQPIIARSLGEISAKRVIIATDADREGESIGREAVNIILSKNPKIKVDRAYFSSITKDELNDAFSKTLPLNEKMADAADSRREIDLYWGAVLTRFMSTNTGMVGKDFLSVGRVQSPTLAAIVTKELEIENFKSSPYWEIEIELEKQKTKFKAEYKKGRIVNKEEAEKAFAKIGKDAKVINLDKKEIIIKRPEPFNTTDFLRASTNLNLDAIKAMEIAENLYMRGFVSYPRTDNQTYIGLEYVKLLNTLKGSEFDSAINKILALPKIVPSKGVETKDHPPIHPVTLAQKGNLHPEEWKVYKLIVDHFLATLYKDAKAQTTNAEFDANSEIFVSKGIIFIDRGWLDIYPYATQKDALLPELIVGEMLLITNKELLSKKTQPPARYSQGTLIKLMEKLNLGTKSTRPSILQKLYFRQYISGKKQIKPSDMAKTVIKSLQDYAQHVVSPDMTAKLEDEMNEIELGKLIKEKVVDDSRTMLLEILDDLYKNKKEISTNIKATAQKANLVGKCPKCNSNLVKRKSKMGKIFVGCSGYPNCTQSYPLPQKGELTFTLKSCEVCKAPIIQLKQLRSKDVSEFCINPGCSSNKEYAIKYAERKEEYAKQAADKLAASAEKKNAIDVVKKEKIEKPKEIKVAKPKLVKEKIIMRKSLELEDSKLTRNVKSETQLTQEKKEIKTKVINELKTKK